MKLRTTMLIGTASFAALGFAVDSAMAADSSTTVQEIVVPGIRQSLEKAIQIKRVSENSVDAISATDIGKLPDKNIADALQRLPGVAIQGSSGGEGGFDEADRVSIRGTSPSLTNVTIDGHNVATGDWFILDQYSVVGRSVSFDLMPSEIVQNVVVSKTQDASILEGGVSGAVDIQTRNPLGLAKTFTFEASAEAAYNTNAGKLGSQWQPQFNGLLGWKNADDTFGVILQGFYEKRSVVRYGQEVLGWTTITAPTPGAASTAPATEAALPQLVGDAFPNLIGSSLFEQERTRAGATGSVEWKTSDDKAELRLSGFYSHLNASNVNNNYMFWGVHEFSNNVPTSYTVQNNTITSAAFNNSTDGMIVDNITRPGEYAESYFVNLDGKFRLNDKLTIKTQIGYTGGLGDTPQQPSFESDAVTGVSYMPSGNGFLVNPTNINPLSPAGLNNDWAWNARFTSRDTEYYAKADGEWDVSSGIWKDVDFGVRYANHERKVDGWDRGCSLGGTASDPTCWTTPMPFADTNPTPYPSGYNAGALGIPGLLIPIAGNPATIGQIIDGINDGVHGPISSIVQAQNYYWPAAFKVQETDIEGYVMVRVGGDRWRGNFGLRIADTNENAYANVPDPLGTNPADITSSAFGDYYIDHVKHNYLDVLPSANFTFNVTDKLLWRAAAAETMSRPDYSSLGGAVSLTDSILVGSKGDPNLKPVKATVLDTGLEYYYGPTSLVAVSVFYDNFQSYVGFKTDVETYYNQLLKMNTPYTISYPYNITGELEGVELQWQQPIGWGFGVQANGTYVHSQDATGAPLIGTSTWVGNLVGYYEAHNVSVRLAYTYRSHFFVGLDRASPESQANFGQLDASFAYQLTPNVALTVDALNITDSRLKYYGANTTQIRAIYNNGTQLFMGVKVKF
ncbi:MAG TPA: TonB-dependent receptor [Caulobacteraceae bacterium]|jgi:iron complex outermembrane receptor protein|nr:TonB-dependent receptor [Caulobacteraceae bacterium]